MQLFDQASYEFSLYSVPTLLTTVITLSLGAVVLIRERTSLVSISFFLLAIAAAIWQFAFAWVYAASNEATALWWIKVSYLGAPFIAAATYQFTIAALHIERRFRLAAIGGWALAIVFSAIVLGTDWQINGIYHYWWGYHPHFTWVGAVFLAYFFSMFAASMLHYALEYHSVYSEIYKGRIKMLMTALAVAYIGSIDFIANFGIPIYPFGYIGVLGFFMLTIPAIWSHRLVNITPAFAANQIIKTMNDAVLVLDVEGIVRLLSPAAIQLFNKSEAELIGKQVPLIIDGKPMSGLLDRFMQAEKTQNQEIGYYRGQGDYRIISLSASVMRDRSDQAMALVCIARDITEQKRSEEALRESETRFHAIFEHALDPLVILDDNGMIVDANPAACDLLARDKEELANRRYTDFLQPHRVSGSLETWRLFLKQDEEKGELEVVRSDGEIRHTEYYARSSFLPGLHLAALRDVTERKALEKRLAHQAFHDALTSLPNRALFMDRLGQALARSRRGTGPVAVLFLDLDDFKVINDSLGHKAGDQLLIMVGNRLNECLRTGDTVARLGGDEFTILLEGRDAASAATVADRVAEQLKKPFNLEERAISVTTSIGIAISPEGIERPDDLLRNADMALYEAKRKEKARYVVFDDSMNSKAWQRLEMEIEMRRALERGEFAVYYQPIVDLRIGKVVEVEALLRWHHPERGIVSPVEFIPFAEETGLIIPLGQWVLEEACRQVKAWQDQRVGTELILSANLSARQLRDPQLIDNISAALKGAKLSAEYLKLEITESVALDNTQATLVTLRALRNLGIQIAIDDFGTGYSALSYVKHYPIDTLKLDRSFVNGLGKEPEDTAIVHAVLAFAKALGLKVTAEGIETAEQIIQLQQLGCEQGQGFYFARPMPPQMAATIFDTNFTRELEMKTRPLEFSLIAGTSILPTKL